MKKNQFNFIVGGLGIALSLVLMGQGCEKTVTNTFVPEKIAAACDTKKQLATTVSNDKNKEQMSFQILTEKGDKISWKASDDKAKFNPPAEQGSSTQNIDLTGVSATNVTVTATVTKADGTVQEYSYSEDSVGYDAKCVQVK